MLGAGALLPTALVACGGSDPRPGPRTVKIGFLNPRSGPRGVFGSADEFVLAGIEKALSGGIDVNGRSHPVEILSRDSGPEPADARAATERLIGEGVDIILGGTAPEMVSPISAARERRGVPCVTTLSPWQPWLAGLEGERMTWSYHYFWGAEDLFAVYLDLWGQLPTNNRTGGLWADDEDGHVFSDAEHGFPPSMTAAGFEVVDPGRYQELKADFRPEIEHFIRNRAEILTGTPLPPDFATFWHQSQELGYRPKIVTVAKALLFPESVDALGAMGEGLSTEVWWSPRYPFSSSLTGESCSRLAADYSAATGNQWLQLLGFIHSLFEVGVDTLRRTHDLDDPSSVLAALRATDLDTIAGRVAWTGRPAPNVSTTPLVGGQWTKGADFPYELRIVTNKALPEVPVETTLQPLPVT